jgi:hypothetical protein
MHSILVDVEQLRHPFQPCQPCHPHVWISAGRLAYMAEYYQIVVVQVPQNKVCFQVRLTSVGFINIDQTLFSRIWKSELHVKLS